jgi:AraC-like DNA-binding protein
MPQTPPEFYIPSSYSRIVARELRLPERELGQLLRGTGLPIEILLPGDETQITGQQQLRVLENARQLSALPEFGLCLGRKLGPSAHGPMGYLALSSPDLITALEALRDFLPVRIPFAQLGLQLDTDWLSCSLQIALPASPESRRLLLECFALVIQSMVEAVLGRSLTEATVLFDFERPAYHRVYRQFLHSRVRFSKPDNTFLLPAKLARVRNACGDTASYAMAQAMCQSLLQQVPGSSVSMAGRVRRLLLSQPMGTVSEQDLALALYVSKRTLARRLQQEGTGYRQIREQLLSQLASRHLQESGLSVEAVAALLGYHDTANFRRAFKRWFGQTPQAYRRRNAAPDSDNAKHDMTPLSRSPGS